MLIHLPRAARCTLARPAVRGTCHDHLHRGHPQPEPAHARGRPQEKVWSAKPPKWDKTITRVKLCPTLSFSVSYVHNQLENLDNCLEHKYWKILRFNIFSQMATKPHPPRQKVQNSDIIAKMKDSHVWTNLPREITPPNTTYYLLLVPFPSKALCIAKGEVLMDNQVTVGVLNWG